MTKNSITNLAHFNRYRPVWAVFRPSVDLRRLCAYGYTLLDARTNSRSRRDYSLMLYGTAVPDFRRAPPCYLAICPGLVVYPNVPRQRCWAHKLRNVAGHCRKRNEKEVIAGARLIYLAKTRRDAMATFEWWRSRWAESEPRTAEILESDLEGLLAMFELPVEHCN